MGLCLSTPKNLLDQVDGDEAAYHERFMEDKILGQGEFAMVKLVHDIENRNNKNGSTSGYASKALKKGIQFKDNTLYSPLKPEILRGECEILKTLAGQHYCLALIGVYETPKVIYIVTELCAGGEMMEYVSQQDELRTERVSQIAFQLLDALHHCANHGVLHRDVKPENTMFCNTSSSADLRLIDFGSGTMDREETPTTHTTMAGSGFYISPELFQRNYTTKTDVWSAGVTLYVLVAGYPVDALQKAFNLLHKSQRNLRDLPQMPEQMPDSFIELLDGLLTYNPTKRCSAGDMLNHEFVMFHNTLEQQGLSLDDIYAEASEQLMEMQPLSNSSIHTSAPKRTQSVNLSGSVQRHSIFLDYQKYERYITTLLATLLTKTDLESLLSKLDAHCSAEEQVEVEVEHSKAKLQKLKVIPMNELIHMLEEMKQDRVLSLMENLPNSALYSTFAFHVAMLHQFSRGTMPTTGSPTGSQSSTKGPNSVHGNNVFDKKRAASVYQVNKDNSWHSGQHNKPIVKSASFSK